jgi:Protein of unknown function (DUF3631)
MRLLGNLFGNGRKGRKRTQQSLHSSTPGTAGTPGASGSTPSTALALALPAVWVREDGDSILDAVTAAIARAVIMTNDDAATCALFALHAHCLDAANISPVLAITAPAHGCGKTTLLRVMAALVPSPLVASDVSPAALYRTIGTENRTLLLDEGHGLLGDNRLQRLLNAGHCRDGATVCRADGTFNLWSATIIAMIGDLPASLGDRALRISLKRKRAGEAITSLPALAATLHQLAAQAARWAVQHLDRLAAADPAMPELVINRAADNWRALLAIADVAGGRWPDLARALATKAAAETAVDDSSGIALLRDLASYFRHLETTKLTDRISSEDLCFYLTTLAERPWRRYNRGGPITPYRVARLLRPFGIRSNTIRFEEDLAKGYYLGDFHEAFERYLK